MMAVKSASRAGRLLGTHERRMFVTIFLLQLVGLGGFFWSQVGICFPERPPVTVAESKRGWE
jgi:hypothetical protein